MLAFLTSLFTEHVTSLLLSLIAFLLPGPPLPLPQFFLNQFSLSLLIRLEGPCPGPALRPPTVLSHDEDVPTLVFRWQEDLWYHDKDLALGWRVDVPDALYTGWVVAWVVGGLNIASKLTQLPTTLTICSQETE